MTLTPEVAAYCLWAAMLVSWMLAALWSDRAARKPPALEELGYVAITFVGFYLLFVGGPGGKGGGYRLLSARWPFMKTQLWDLPETAAWVLVGVTAAGFLFCWWARLHLGRLWSGTVGRKADHRIVDTGPYGLVRHPIYTGLIIPCFCLAALKAMPGPLAGAVLTTLGFWIKARLEERFLRQELGAEAYDAYARRVPMLIPFLPR